MRHGQTIGLRDGRMGVAALPWLCSFAACTSASGGAVDLSWRLKPSAGFADDFIDCNKDGTLTDSNGQPIQGVGKLTSIRLYWQAGDALGPPNENLPHEDFSCSTENGVTSFQIQPGDALLYVTPQCFDAGSAFEAKSCTYTAPTAVQRTMVAGQTVQLHALEIVLDVGTGSASANTCMSVNGAPPPTACICTTASCP